MEENAIYKFMRENNLTQLDEKSFVQKYSDPNEALKIHKFMVENNLTELPSADFYNKYFQLQVEQPVIEQPVQKKNESVAYGQFGAIGLQRSPDYRPEIGERSVFEFISDNAKSFATGVSNFIPNTLETLAVGQSFVENLISDTGRKASEITFPVGMTRINPYLAAQEYRKKIEEILPVSEEQQQSFWGQTSVALGEMVPIILSGFAGGGAKLGAKELTKEAAKRGTKLTAALDYTKGMVSRMGTPQGALTLAQVTAPSYSQAIQEGATEMEATTYALQNALVSFPIEMLPVSNMFKRLDNVIPGNKGVEIVKRALIGGVEEGVTEGFQNVYENMSANVIYDANKEMLEGIGDATAVGGTVGFIINSALSALTGRRIKTTNPEEQKILDKAIEETEAKLETIESNNEKIKETVQELEKIKIRKLNDGDSNLDFIEKDGSIEYTQDGLDEKSATSLANKLAVKYPNLEFTVVNNTPEDVYAMADFTIVGNPKTTPQPKYSVQGKEVPKEIVSVRIETAESAGDLKDISVENDPELESTLKNKVDELQNATITEQPASEESRTQEPTVAENVPEEPTAEGIDTEVQISKPVFTIRDGEIVEAKVNSKSKSATQIEFEDGNVTVRANTEVFDTKEEAENRFKEELAQQKPGGEGAGQEVSVDGDLIQLQNGFTAKRIKGKSKDGDTISGYQILNPQDDFYKITLLKNEETGEYGLGETNLDFQQGIDSGILIPDETGFSIDVEKTIQNLLNQSTKPKQDEKALQAETEAKKVEVFKTAKSAVKIKYMSAKELVGAKDPVQAKSRQEEIKKRHKKILQLIDCLQS